MQVQIVGMTSAREFEERNQCANALCASVAIGLQIVHDQLLAQKRINPAYCEADITHSLFHAVGFSHINLDVGQNRGYRRWVQEFSLR